MMASIISIMIEIKATRVNPLTDAQNTDNIKR